MATLLFLDTNVFLHYQDFDNLPWKTLCKDSVTIVIPPITIRELNKHKDTHSRPRIRRRADVTLKKLANLLGASLTTQLNEDVELILESRDPLIDFSENQLSPEVNDDQLIASILMAKGELPSAAIILVTSDTGLTLRAKAQRLAIQTMALSDAYKLPEEPDPEKIRIRELEAEIRELKATRPELSVTFEGESQRVVLNFEAPVISDSLTQEEVLENLRERYPKLEPLQTHNPEGLEPPIGIRDVIRRSSFYDTISSEDIETYNSQLEKFFEEYSEYLRIDARYQEVKSSSAILRFWLLNNGTAPAKDIDVYLHFPDGFYLFDPERFPDAPEPPNPPERPLTQLEKRLRPLFNMSLNHMYFPTLRSFPDPTPSREPNVSYPTIKRTNSYKVSYEIRYIKHGIKEPLGELLLVFGSLEAAHSFQVNYEILAANIPHKVTGELHIIVERT